jgi:hypothetical protein
MLAGDGLDASSCWDLKLYVEIPRALRAPELPNLVSSIRYRNHVDAPRGFGLPQVLASGVLRR